MSVMKSLWASIQGDPVFMRKVNGWLTTLDRDDPGLDRYRLDHECHVRRRPVALGSGVGSLVRVAGGRVEVLQAEEAEKREREDVSKDVVERMIERDGTERRPERCLNGVRERRPTPPT